MKTKSSKELNKLKKKFIPETKSNVIRNGKHVIIDFGQDKLKSNFKTSGDI